MKKNKLFFIGIVIFAFVFQMCEKEDEKPAYVGEWETAVYKFPVGETLIDQKMAFNFEETNFEAKIKNIIQGTPIDFLGVRGNVTEKETKKLDVSLTEIGQFSASINNFDWKTRANDTTEFNALYSGYLSNSLPKDFEAEFVVEGDKLDLIIAAVNDTIHLFKK